MNGAQDKLKVLFASAEAAPWAKVGGLGDVAAALPAALAGTAGSALDIRLILPFHAEIKRKNPTVGYLGAFSVPNQTGVFLRSCMSLLCTASRPTFWIAS